MLDDPNWQEYLGVRVRDRGKPVGTVVDFDADRAAFYLEPSPEIDENTWDGLGWGDRADYDRNWEDVDYDRWRDGESDLPVDYDEWPCTLPNARLEESEDGEELRLVSAT
ncbi:hypothetical protein [Halosimplex pelagicum]|uniref:Uncharacterized protein n=1 Tax=Halosimplex pelagicum TaxID=869886 RepID=A0A7D5P9W0_9EURY|nr:hypothetical protein [Halosimplex pelagicum]QLH80798.1 hypothetical protein HZS54_03715 [Halosimplex pelagicum]